MFSREGGVYLSGIGLLGHNGPLEFGKKYTLLNGLLKDFIGLLENQIH